MSRRPARPTCLEAVVEFLRAHEDEAFSVKQISEETGFSESHTRQTLERLLKSGGPIEVQLIGRAAHRVHKWSFSPGRVKRP